MIKVFTLNKNNKIELTKEELESLLNDAYWEGYRNNKTWTYVSPHTTPYYTITCNQTTTDLTNTTVDKNSVTLCNTGSITGGYITNEI